MSKKIHAVTSRTILIFCILAWVISLVFIQLNYSTTTDLKSLPIRIALGIIGLGIVFSPFVLLKWRLNAKNRKFQQENPPLSQSLPSTPQTDEEFLSAFEEGTERDLAITFRYGLAKLLDADPQQIHNTFTITSIEQVIPAWQYIGEVFPLNTPLPDEYANNHPTTSDQYPFALLAFICGSPWWIEQQEHLSKMLPCNITSFIQFYINTTEKTARVLKEFDHAQP